jgi:hypothetical protein
VHFLKQPEGFVIGRPRACVTVKVIDHKGKRLQVQTGDGAKAISVLKADALVTPLPDGWTVVDDEGEPIRPTWGFYVTTESFDPAHLVTDWDGR